MGGFYKKVSSDRVFALTTLCLEVVTHAVCYVVWS